MRVKPQQRLRWTLCLLCACDVVNAVACLGCGGAASVLPCDRPGALPVRAVNRFMKLASKVGCCAATAQPAPARRQGERVLSVQRASNL
eukprot:3146159-Prymnesium_polylepis.1